MAGRLTGDFWNVDNPDKPWGKFDVKADLIFPIYWDDWCAQIGGTLVDAEVDALPHFLTSATIDTDGLLTVVRVQVLPEYLPSIVPKVKYPFKVNVRSDNASNSQADGRTFWLQVFSR